MSLANSTPPTLYQYYTDGGIASGLSANQSYFTLNDKNITLYSGAMHYFRVPPQYWRDRLRKMRAAGLNTVETYVPWNLHEPMDGYYDFGNGGTDFEQFLDVPKFLKTAQEEDLFVIVRSGPYICAEWEFGGFPSWLLRNQDIKLRTSDSTYMKYVTRYFNLLLGILATFQFTMGGPIIAFQVENEYGSTATSTFTPDKVYLEQLRTLMVRNGIHELLTSADGVSMSGTRGTLPEYFLMTANFGGDPLKEFTRLNQLQPGKPTMAMEFWSGWFDHWSENHHTRINIDFYAVLNQILSYPASVNMYMFHGGTTWGFMNGANFNNSRSDNSNYQPDTTSYDYDSPLTENGDYTVKYQMVKSLIRRYNEVVTRLPDLPEPIPRKKYQAIDIVGQLGLEEVLERIPVTFQSPHVIPMELLPMNALSGQSYGYIVYRKPNLYLPPKTVLTITGHVCDSVIVLINGVPLNKPLQNSRDLNGFGFWRLNNSAIIVNAQELSNATLDLVVENFGRGNFGRLEQFNQFKGLWQGPVLLNDQELEDWTIFPLEFHKAWNLGLDSWSRPNIQSVSGPALYKTTLEVTNTEYDTYVDMSAWTKGIVIVNGFVLGRYCKIGPQQTLYLPGPFLHIGKNTIVVFEQFSPGRNVSFSLAPIYKTIT